MSKNGNSKSGSSSTGTKKAFVPADRKGNLHDRVGVPQGKILPGGLEEKILHTPVGKKVSTPAGSIVVTVHDREMANESLNMQKGENSKRKR